MSDYKDTLNLPQTSFPMRANLTKNEPKMLKFWQEIDVYQQMISKNNNKPRYILHDGPPYANGHIHLGTSLNKILKDIIVKFKNLSGFKAEYVPGWDCHGLPIELKVEQTLKKEKKELPVVDIRKKCREYALKYLAIQREEFKRLGVFGLWDEPYLTMSPEYEAATARELGRFMQKRGVKRSKKPIYWCISCETALAEAEVEYAEHTSVSIYVRFPVNKKSLAEKFPQISGNAYVVIWTTTPWTLPDNMAIAVHPEFDYVWVKVKGEFYLLAERLLAVCAEIFGWEDYEKVATISGQQIEGLETKHPFYERKSPVVLAEYVTLESGTGCVHTAPGHGPEDYETGLRYGLDILSPLDDQGRFLPQVEFFAGLDVFSANPKVIEKLQEVGNLLTQTKINHSYPHCWRCKKPVIFRATTQWFISMEANDLRKKALQAIKEQVQWIPAWGRDRIYNMVEQRPDWCISRQRAWGVPIIALICKSCGEAWFDADWVMEVVKRFENHPRGADYWFEAPLSELVPEGLKCPHCGQSEFEKEDDILDVWFDSGTSFAAVLEKRPECAFPADLYLEGSDQHRGWFHSSLLASIGTRGVPPYRAVLTHGYVVDGEGRKMSKSIGNVIAPEEIIKKYGAEILRLWVSSVNYQEDVRISDEILKRLVDAYRRIRNTSRFLLGNLKDFQPQKDLMSFEEMLPLDRYGLFLTLQADLKMQRAYANFEFHKVFHVLHNLCVTELSAFYLDVLKDRLYVSASKSKERLSAQTALYYILFLILKNIAPILSFTAEEIFQHLPEGLKLAGQSVFGTDLPTPEGFNFSEQEKLFWDMIYSLREEVTKAIEPKRKNGVVGHSLECKIGLFLPEQIAQDLKEQEELLREVFIVSRVEFLSEKPRDDYFTSQEIENLLITVEKACGQKCQRCWVYHPQVGEHPKYPDVCPRCAKVLELMGE
ncbi:MAG: isoleucine--tRNA ligase [Desulfonauticus sp.]|nr:isoleucine--tRNA ligase [Desulfonauticus sp.]